MDTQINIDFFVAVHHELFCINFYFQLFLGHTPRHVGSQFLDQGSNPHPLHRKCRVLTGLPGKSQVAAILCQKFFRNIQGSVVPFQCLRWKVSTSSRLEAAGVSAASGSTLDFSHRRGVGKNALELNTSRQCVDYNSREQKKSFFKVRNSVGC